MKKYINALIFIYFCLFNPNSFVKAANFEKYEKLISKYNIELNNGAYYDNKSNQLKAKNEIETDKELMSIPIQNIMSSEEPYQFKEYFNTTSKQKLIGRLLVENLLEKDSVFFDYIKTLPSPLEMKDYYHLSNENKIEFNKRIFRNDQNGEAQRKKEYERLSQKIPSNTAASSLLNWELYNWASSIISCYAIAMKKMKYGQLTKIWTLESYEKEMPEELCLVPGLNLIKKGEFKVFPTNAYYLTSSLYAYKDKILLNSDRFTEEGQEIFNDIDYRPYKNSFENCGVCIDDYYHTDVFISPRNDLWTLKKIDLCNALDCLSGRNQPEFVFGKMHNYEFALFLKIDQLANEDNFKEAYKKFKTGHLYTKKNYIKSLAKGIQIFNQFIKENKKTKLSQDLKDYEKVKGNDVLKSIINYAISQKMIILSQIKNLNERIIKQFESEIFGDIKKKYIR